MKIKYSDNPDPYKQSNLQVNNRPVNFAIGINNNPPFES